MMAQKAKLFNDEEIFAQILQVKHPNEAKQLGRKVRNYDEQIWQENRFDIVVQANFAKFSQYSELKNSCLQRKTVFWLKHLLSIKFGVLVWHKIIQISKIHLYGKV